MAMRCNVRYSCAKSKAVVSTDGELLIVNNVVRVGFGSSLTAEINRMQRCEGNALWWPQSHHECTVYWEQLLTSHLFIT